MGIVTALLLLESATCTPAAGACCVKPTVQVVDSPSVSRRTKHESDDTAGRTAGALRLREKVRDDPFALAVRTAVVSEVTAEFASAVNVCEVEPDATVTAPGTDTSALLLASATEKLPEGAAPLRVTAQLDDAGGVIVLGLQTRPLTCRSCG